MNFYHFMMSFYEEKLGIMREFQKYTVNFIKLGRWIMPIFNTLQGVMQSTVQFSVPPVLGKVCKSKKCRVLSVKIAISTFAVQKMCRSDGVRIWNTENADDVKHLLSPLYCLP